MAWYGILLHRNGRHLPVNPSFCEFVWCMRVFLLWASSTTAEASNRVTWCARFYSVSCSFSFKSFCFTTRFFARSGDFELCFFKLCETFIEMKLLCLLPMNIILTSSRVISIVVVGINEISVSASVLRLSLASLSIQSQTSASGESV